MQLLEQPLCCLTGPIIVFLRRYRYSLLLLCFGQINGDDDDDDDDDDNDND